MEWNGIEGSKQARKEGRKEGRKERREAFGYGRDDVKRKWKRGEMMARSWPMDCSVFILAADIESSAQQQQQLID
jgi:hypothetical protein